MHKQYFGIVFSISLIAQPMMAAHAHISEIDWKGTAQQSIGLLLKPNRKGIEKITPLSKAVLQGNVGAVKKLIDAQSNPQAKAAFVNSFGADPYQVTPLHYAAAKENTDLIAVLLTAGANPNAQDSWQCTPLMWAISNGKDKAATLLASKTDLTIRDNLGRTALHWAAAKVNQAVVTILLSQEAVVRAKDNQGNTPLHYAASVKYRFGHHDPQDDAGAAMSGKFVQAAAIATAGMQPTEQNQAIMNKAINLGMAAPVAGVASFAGGKGSGVVIIAPNAQGTGVNAIGMPVSDTANPTPISPDTATIVNSSQASPTEVLQAASGASAPQDASGVAAQADASPTSAQPAAAATSAKSLKSVTNKSAGKAKWSSAKKSVPSQIDIDAIDIHTHVGNEGDAFWNSSFTAADLQPKQTYENPAYNPNSPSLYKNMPSQAAAAPAISPEEALNNATQAYFNNNSTTVAKLNSFASANSRTITYNQSTTYEQLAQELNDIKGQVAQYSGKGLAADEITALNNEKAYIKLLSQAVDAVQSEVSPSVMQQVQRKIVSFLPVSKNPAASTTAVQQPASSELAREESSTLLKMEEPGLPSGVEGVGGVPRSKVSGVEQYNPPALQRESSSMEESLSSDVGGVSLETTNAEAAQGVAKPGVIAQVADYLTSVASNLWATMPETLTAPVNAAAGLVSKAASAVMSSISGATTYAAEQAGNAIIAAAGYAGIEEATVVGAGTAVGATLGTTVGEAASALGYEGVIDAAVADIPVVDIVLILATALQLAIQYGIQAQEKTDQRNKRAEIDGRRDNIITALLKKDTKTITNNNNPYVSDFPAYLTANSKGRVPSHFAAMSGNSGPQQLINKLVNDPTVLTVVDNAGYTPLMYAIMRGRKDNLNPSGLSNVMLAQGFTKNTNATGTKTFVNPTNVTPLKTSLMFGGGKLFDTIFAIVHTSDVYTDIVGRNILHYAALDGKQIEKVYKAYSSVPWYTCLVSSTSSETGPYRQMDPKDNPWVTSQDMYGATPLHYAAATSAKGFKFLLAKAGKVDLTTLLDKNGMTVLHYAAMCGRVEVIHEIMNHEGNKKTRAELGEIKSKMTDTYGNAVTPNLAGKTAIDLASISGHPQAVRVLAKHVAESKTEKKALLAEAKQSKRATAQQTKQQEKVSKGQSRVAKLQMREAKSKVMIDPLIAGVKAGRGNVVLAYNQPSNLTATESGTGMTALMYAVKEGREQMVKQILDALKQQNLTAQVLAMTDAKGETASAMTKNKKIQAMLTQAASSTVAGGVVTGTPTPTTTKAKKATSVIGRKTTNLPMNQR